MTKGLQVISDFEPAGSQPEAIDNLVDGLNGLFFNHQNSQSLLECIQKFNSFNFDSKKIKESVKRFDNDIFYEEIKKTIDRYKNESN